MKIKTSLSRIERKASRALSTTQQKPIFIVLLLYTQALFVVRLQTRTDAIENGIVIAFIIYHSIDLCI